MDLMTYEVTRRVNGRTQRVDAASPADAWGLVVGGTDRSWEAVREGSGWTIANSTNGVVLGRVMEARA